MGIHGGDIYRNPVSIDFSVNVNPLGVPKDVVAALHKAVETCSRYPDIEAEKLKAAVSASLAVPEAYLLFGNGASELFMAVVHGIRPKKTVIPVPSFFGYEYAAKAVDSEILYYEMKQENNFRLTKDIKEILTEDVDLLFLANPNNPTGNLTEKETLREVLLHCAQKGIFVVLDECFIAFSGNGFSMLSEIEAFDNLLLIRACTKIFAIPGVRLGCLFSKNRAVLDRIAGQLPEWNLSCFAQEAGCICTKQEAFMQETQRYVQKERRFLEEALTRRGFRIFSSEANFILLYSEKPLYERFLEKGILIRDCSNFRGLGKGFYRIAVRTRKENEILLENL